MADVSKSYGVGDTVYVWYHDSPTLENLPQSRVVAKVEVNSATNEAVVSFNNGAKVTDGATQRVFDTQALCAAAIVNAAITRYTAAVLLDTATLSGASTAGSPATTLIRKN